MSDLLKDLADIRDRMELAMDAVRKARPASADGAGEPKWYELQGYGYACRIDGERIGTVWQYDGWHWASIYAISGMAASLDRAKELVELSWKTEREEKRAALGKPEAVSPLAELLPCPYCGGRAEAKAGRCVECQTCFASSEDFPSQEEAVTAWNRRAPSLPAAKPTGPRPCNYCHQPDAVTKAAKTELDCLKDDVLWYSEKLVDADREFTSVCEKHGIPFTTIPALKAVYSAVDAYRVAKAKAAAVDGAGKGAGKC